MTNCDGTVNIITSVGYQPTCYVDNNESVVQSAVYGPRLSPPKALLVVYEPITFVELILFSKFFSFGGVYVGETDTSSGFQSLSDSKPDAYDGRSRRDPIRIISQQTRTGH